MITWEKPVLTGYKKCDWIRLLYLAPRVGFKALLGWIAFSRNRLFLPRLGSEELECTVGTAAELKAKKRSGGDLREGKSKCQLIKYYQLMRI